MIKSFIKITKIFVKKQNKILSNQFFISCLLNIKIKLSLKTIISLNIIQIICDHWNTLILDNEINLFFILPAIICLSFNTIYGKDLKKLLSYNIIDILNELENNENNEDLCDKSIDNIKYFINIG